MDLIPRELFEGAVKYGDERCSDACNALQNSNSALLMQHVHLKPHIAVRRHCWQSSPVRVYEDWSIFVSSFSLTSITAEGSQ